MTTASLEDLAPAQAQSMPEAHRGLRTVRSAQTAGQRRLVCELRDYTMNAELMATWAAQMIGAGFFVETLLEGPTAADQQRSSVGRAYEW